MFATPCGGGCGRVGCQRSAEVPPGVERRRGWWLMQVTRDLAVQVTKEGINTILYYRKALLQLLAGPLAPAVPMVLRMRDFVAGAGGPLLDTVVKQVHLNDQGLCDMLEVLCGRALPSFPLMMTAPLHVRCNLPQGLNWF